MMHSTFSTTSLSDRKYLCFSFYWNFYRWVEVCYGYKTLVWELLFCNGRFLLFFSVSCCSFNSIIESFAWLHLKSLRTYKKVHLEMLQEIIIRNILLLLEFHQNLSKSLFTIQISELLLYSLGMTEFHFPKFYLKYFAGFLRWRTSLRLHCGPLISTEDRSDVVVYWDWAVDGRSGQWPDHGLTGVTGDYQVRERLVTSLLPPPPCQPPLSSPPPTSHPVTQLHLQSQPNYSQYKHVDSRGHTDFLRESTNICLGILW